MAIRNLQSLPLRQRGAALITGLLIMMVMTLIGIAAMESSVIQGNLATNAQLNTVSFQATEATLARATSFTYLSQAMADEVNGASLAVQEDTSLDKKTRNAGSGGKVTVTTTGQVDFCGTLAPELTQGLGLDANQSITNNAYTRYVFDLVVRTDVGNGGNVQASTQHTQRSTRLMLSKQGGGIPLCNI